jgi:acyl transferase domain-containing protein
MFRGLKRAHFLSPTGQCKPFDEEADGYCRAEGAGAVVVKKLSYAAKEGDHIYGVIRGICINQCGTAKSITHPHAGTQEALFKQVLNISRVTPESISVVEAHGTGTQAGDFAEVSSLKAVFDSSAFTSRRSSPLYLSSVKGNLGHAEAASGIAGLAKLLLMMEKQAIPPQASHNKANPRLKLQESRRLHVPTQLQEWSLEPFQPARRALLNNFGASGSNVALILEEYQPPVAETKLESITHHTFTLSGKNLNTLDSLRSDYIEKLSGSFNATIQDVCYTANARTQPLSPFKLAVVADDTAGLVRRLQNVTDAERRCSSAEKLPKVVFSFSGQGDMRPAVGAELLASNSTFCAVVKDCDALLCANGFRPVSPFLKGSSEGDESEDIVVSQCACFVLQLALANMWIAWGISPNLVVGHSIGEYAAFSVSGVLNWKDALLFVSNRAKSMVSKCAGSSSGMLACRMTADAADKLLQVTDTTITCYNSVQDIVIGGETVSLHKLIPQLKDKGVKHKLLQVPYAFHSSAMDPMLGELRSHAAGLKMRQMAVQTGSSLEGKILDSETTLATDYFVRHAREPVLFSSLVSDVARWSANTEITVIEIGPSGSSKYPPLLKTRLCKVFLF